jgi:hypothetical protein
LVAVAVAVALRGDTAQLLECLFNPAACTLGHHSVRYQEPLLESFCIPRFREVDRMTVCPMPARTRTTGRMLTKAVLRTVPLVD